MGNVFEPPAAQVPVERVSGIHSAKVKIAAAVAVDVAGGNPGAVQEIAIEDGARLRNAVGKADPELLVIEEFKSGFALVRHVKPCPSKTRARLPSRKQRSVAMGFGG